MSNTIRYNKILDKKSKIPESVLKRILKEECYYFINEYYKEEIKEWERYNISIEKNRLINFTISYRNSFEEIIPNRIKIPIFIEYTTDFKFDDEPKKTKVRDYFYTFIGNARVDNLKEDIELLESKIIRKDKCIETHNRSWFKPIYTTLSFDELTKFDQQLIESNNCVSNNFLHEILLGSKRNNKDKRPNIFYFYLALNYKSIYERISKQTFFIKTKKESYFKIDLNKVEESIHQDELIRFNDISKVLNKIKLNEKYRRRIKKE